MKNTWSYLILKDLKNVLIIHYFKIIIGWLINQEKQLISLDLCMICLMINTNSDIYVMQGYKIYPTKRNSMRKVNINFYYNLFHLPFEDDHMVMYIPVHYHIN